MYIAAIITIAQSWKQIKCTLIDNLVDIYCISIKLIKYVLKHIFSLFWMKMKWEPIPRHILTNARKNINIIFNEFLF